VFFPESDHAVRNKQNKDDEEVRPMRSTPDRITAASIIQGIGPQKY